MRRLDKSLFVCYHAIVSSGQRTTPRPVTIRSRIAHCRRPPRMPVWSGCTSAALCSRKTRLPRAACRTLGRYKHKEVW